MPQSAQEAIEDGLRIGRLWDDTRREEMVRRTQLKAVGMTLQLSGQIPPHDDPEWILNVLEETQLESLRLWALMSGEIPRNSPAGRGNPGVKLKPGNKGWGHNAIRDRHLPKPRRD